MTEAAIKDQSKNLISSFEQVDGMMSITAAAAFLAVFKQLRQLGITGHWFETGVYKGKSATLLCGSASKDEDVVLIDIDHHKSWGHLNALHDSIVSVETESEKIEQNFQLLPKYFNKTMVLHSDGSHFYDNVYSDIVLANKLLSEDGVLILDDFWNAHYPQVQAAAYSYLAAFPEHFSFFLTGENKAFLCRPSRHKNLINYCLTYFAGDMAELGSPVVVSKTDINPKFDVLSFMHKRHSDEESFFGMNIYSHFYQPR